MFGRGDVQPIASSTVPVVGDGACVCEALDAHWIAACRGVACRVQNGQCQYLDASNSLPITQQQLAFGENPTDDVQMVTKDTELRQSSPTTNFGGGTTMHLLNAATHVIVGLMRFELTALPENAVIEDAQLALQVATPGADIADPGSQTPLAVYRILESWEEGSGVGLGGAQACSNWNCRSGTNAAPTRWTVPGCGFLDGAPSSREGSAIATVIPTTPGMVYSLDVTAAVAGWVADPSSNFGLEMEDPLDDAALNTREVDPSDGTRPRLTVRYHLPD
jgi:hypothetical protein